MTGPGVCKPIPTYRLEAAMRQAQRMNLLISYRNLELILSAAACATDDDNERFEALAQEADWNDRHGF